MKSGIEKFVSETVAFGMNVGDWEIRVGKGHSEPEALLHQTLMSTTKKR